MKKGLLIALLAGVLIAAGVFILTSSDDTTDTTETSQAPANETSQPAPEADPTDQLIKPEEIAVHNTEQDCWTIVEGMVYDITTYIPRHPGGDSILLACGTDGTSLFNERTTEDGETIGSGTPHSTGAASQLAGFKVGVLDTSAE